MLSLEHLEARRLLASDLHSSFLLENTSGWIATQQLRGLATHIVAEGEGQLSVSNAALAANAAPLNLSMSLGDLLELNLQSISTPLPSGYTATNIEVTLNAPTEGLLYTSTGTIQPTGSFNSLSDKLYLLPKIFKPSSSSDTPGTLADIGSDRAIYVNVKYNLNGIDAAHPNQVANKQLAVFVDPNQDYGALSVATNVEATELDRIRIAHRLRYLGFTTQSTGNVLTTPDTMSQTQFDEALKLFKGATRADGAGGGYENPLRAAANAKITKATLSWLNRLDAPRWVELIDPDPAFSATKPYYYNGGEFDILPGINTVSSVRDGTVSQPERYSTDWATETVKSAAHLVSLLGISPTSVAEST